MSSNGFVGDYTMLLGDIKRGESRISESMKDHLNTEVQTILHRATEDGRVVDEHDAQVVGARETFCGTRRPHARRDRDQENRTGKKS